MNWIKSKLIPEWKVAYKYWSINLQWVLIALSAAYPFLPDIQQYAPGWWVAPIAVLTIIARITQQKTPG